MRILIVEDDRSLAAGLSRALSADGYTVDVIHAGDQLVPALSREHFDLVLLDLGLPGLDGVSALRRLRKGEQPIPVIIITARDRIEDRVSGLDAGADDYLVKPFEIDELRARIRARLRRKQGVTASTLVVGELEIDPQAMTVTRHGEAVPLQRREFALLNELASNAGRVLTRDRLEQALYGWTDDVESNALEVHVHHLRKKLGADCIRTVRGVGYTMPGVETLFSIRRFLFASLVLGVVVVGAVVTLAVYDQAHHEVEELFDAQLAQKGRILSLWLPFSDAPTDPLVLSENVRGHNYERYVAVQHFSAEGELLITSPSMAETALMQPPFQAGLSLQQLADHAWHVFAQPLPGGGWLMVGEREEVRAELARNAAIALVLPWLLAIPLLVLAVVVALRRGLRPLQLLAGAIARRDDSNLKPLHEGADVAELQPLVDALNRLFLRVEEGLLREQRFTADAAHELRTLLTVLKLHASNARDLPDEEERMASLTALLSGVDRATHMVAQLLALARIDPQAEQAGEPVTVLPVLRDVLAQLQPQARARNMDVFLESGEAEDTRVAVPAESQAMLYRNLVENAIRYAPGGSDVQVLTDVQPGWLEIAVVDAGAGISPELAERVCQRFYRGQQVSHRGVSGEAAPGEAVPDEEVPGEGAGLGLSIVQRILERAGGRLRFRARNGDVPAAVVVTLPTL